MPRLSSIDELKELRSLLVGDLDETKPRIVVCAGTACHASGSNAIVRMAKRHIIENSLRDKFHQISSRHVQERVQENSYSWHFESSVVVASRDKKQYVSHLPSSETAEPAAAQQALPRTAASKR